MIEVVPAIIPETFEYLREQVEKVAAHVSRVQIDIMDGAFAPTKSWPFNQQYPTTFDDLVQKKATLPHANDIIYELDMMVERPEEHIDRWINAGFKALIIHIESTQKIPEIVETLKDRYVEMGLALSPKTPLERLLPFVEDVNFVQFMGNDNIGRHGVSLDSFVLPKITDLRKQYPELIIGIDIGVTEETAPVLVECGVNKLVSGSAIFNSENIEETIETFKNLKPIQNNGTSA